MRQQSGGDVIVAYGVPPNPPPGVSKALAEFDRLGDDWARLQGELEDAKTAVEVAQKEDTEAAAAAFTTGQDVEEPDRRERAALVKVRAIQRMLEGAAVAVDQAGNDLLGPIAEAREEWLATLTDEQEAASAAYAAAIAKAKAALDKIKKTSGAIGWLERFDAGQARVGRDRGWHGGGRAEVEDELGRKFDPSSLLVMAAKVNEPTAAEQRAANRAAKKAAQKEKVEA
jgi:hypothetical protein